MKCDDPTSPNEPTTAALAVGEVGLCMELVLAVNAALNLSLIGLPSTTAGTPVRKSLRIFSPSMLLSNFPAMALRPSANARLVRKETSSPIKIRN